MAMYYFAYSSNMNLDHMRRLCGWHFEILGMAELPNYEFGPDIRGYFMVKPKAGSKIPGVLFEVDQECLDALDKFEGHPNVFHRFQTEIFDPEGKEQKSWVYTEAPEQFGGKTIRQEFLRRVIAGAVENRLPENWIKFLESFKE